jgi:hypothetical protein
MSSGRPVWANQRLTLVLDSTAATPFDPQERVMHEMGHVADFVSAPSQGRVVQVNGERDGMSGWAYQTAEYRSKVMSEGLATFFASTALYVDNAPSATARTCFANGMGGAGARHCWETANAVTADLESRGSGACVTSEGRFFTSNLRFIWDLWDAGVDNSPWDNIDASLWDIADAMNTAPCTNYPFCYGSGSLHDAWSSVPSTVNWTTAVVNAPDIDANGVNWYGNLFSNFWGASLSSLATINCTNSI